MIIELSNLASAALVGIGSVYALGLGCIVAKYRSDYKYSRDNDGYYMYIIRTRDGKTHRFCGKVMEKESDATNYVYLDKFGELHWFNRKDIVSGDVFKPSRKFTTEESEDTTKETVLA